MKPKKAKLSLDDLEDEVEAENDRPNSTSAEGNTTTREEFAIEQQPLNEDNLKTVWSGLLALMEQKNYLSLINIIQTYKPSLENDTISLKLESGIQKDFVTERLSLITQYFDAAFGAHKYKFEFTVQEDAQTTRRAFTDKEKLDRIVEANPQMQDLIDRLGLSLDL